MKKWLIIAMLAFAGSEVQAQVTSYLWARQGNTGSGSAAGNLIAALPDLGCVSAGTHSGYSVNFDTVSCSGSTDNSYLVIHDQAGFPQWGRSIGGGSYNYIKGLYADAAGNIYLSGTFYSSSFYLDTMTIYNSTAMHYDAFAIKIDSSRNVVLGFTPDTSGGAAFMDIVADDSGNMYVVGTFSSFIGFDTAMYNASGSSDVFVAGFRSTGELFFMHQIGGSAGETAISLDVSDNGTIAIAGYFAGDSLITQAGTFTNPNPGYADGFMVLLDTTGTEFCTLHARGTGEDYGRNVKFAPDGTVWMLIESSNSVDIGGITVSGFGRKAIWVQVSATGTVLHYNKAYAGDVWPLGLDVDTSGQVYISGKFNGFNIYVNNLSAPGTGGSSAFVIVTDSAGFALDLKVISNGDNVTADDICVNSHNDFFFTGGFLGYNDFVIGNDTLGTNYLPGSHFDPYLVKARGPGSTTGLPLALPSEWDLWAYPNPLQGTTLQVRVPPALSHAVVNITDLQGREVVRFLNTGNTELVLTLPELAEGVYVLRAMEGSASAVQKLVVTNR